MSGIDFNVTVNASQFREKLNQFKKELQIEGVDKALRAAARIFRNAVVARAPVLKTPTKTRASGTLQRAIYAKRSQRSTLGARRYFIGIRQGSRMAKKGKDAFYWRFLEAGWMPRGPGRRLKGGTRFRNLQRKRNLAAGAKQVKYPFIAPAFQAVKGEVETKFNSVMAAYLKKVSNK